ncbi:MAG: signal peptide peptidase SppA [Bacteroidales bacterium]|nr:signal peptide peptidase SppA [Bacteroidales bacterium]
MKFWKTVLAVIVGVILTGIIMLVLSVMFFSSLAASASSQPTLPKEGVLLMDMSSFAVAEQASAPDPMAVIQGGSTTTVSLLDAVNALHIAAEDPTVQFLYLKPEGYAGGFAALEELRKAISDFRAGGKAVVAWLDNPGTGSYYLASAADKVYMTAYEGGTTMFNGISTQLVFLKDLLDKLGVNVQLIRHGKYKSAGEMFIRNASSPENMEQNQEMIDSIWKTFASDIAASRGISVETLNSLIDNLALNFPEDFLNAGLVDELMSRSELEAKITALAVKESIKDVKTMSFPAYVSAKVQPNLKAREKIAVIYADGDIVDSGRGLVGRELAATINKVREDESVKAVVFRVNSPGGSVLASEKIKAEIELLRAAKPVVASYGDYAASGGYWISNSCDKIYSDATTLTGSIGVFSMIPDFSKTLKDIAHVNVTSVNSNRHGDLYGLMRPFDAAETAYMQASVERIYEHFVNIVAEGRELTPDFVDTIAQGRVWTGADALGIGLVDEIGTLSDALAYTAGLAGNPDLAAWRIEAFPKPKSTMDQLKDLLGGNNAALAPFKDTPLESVASAILDWEGSWNRRTPQYMYARIPYAVIPW